MGINLKYLMRRVQGNKVKSNPRPRKYFFTEEQIAEAYKKHDGNYTAMAKELLPAGIEFPGSALYGSIQNEPWVHKYPRRGSRRKYFFTEEQFAEAYKKHDGNYLAMARELLPAGKEPNSDTLYGSIKNEPWAHKYPRKVKRKYFFTEEQIAEAYKKHDGDYTAMGRELLPAGTDQPGSKLYGSIINQPWAHKYPRRGSPRKYFFTEEQIAEAHKKYGGNYSAMGRALLPDGPRNAGAVLFASIKNQPWAHKYPLRKNKALVDIKEQSEEYDDYSFSESFDMPLFKKRKNPIRRSNPEPQFLRAYVNSIAEALWIYCFDFYEAVKLKRPINSVNNSAYLNFYYFVAVMNTDLAYFTMFYTCKMLSNIDFELSLLNNDMRPFNMNIIKALANKSEMESAFATKISVKIYELMEYDSLELDEKERVSEYFKHQIKNEILHDIFIYFVMITSVKDIKPMAIEARNLIKDIFTNYEITFNKKEDVSNHTEDIILLLGCFRYLFAVDEMKFSINKNLSENARLTLARDFGGHINIFVAKNIIDAVIYFQTYLDKEINDQLPPIKPNPSKKQRRSQ